jgi:predicted KAP-like P-loop ATPase
MFSDYAVKNSDDDLFGRKNFAFRISEIIANRTDKDSIAIGIHAPWGEGKTSVLNMIVEGLEEHLQKDNKTLINGNIVLLKFNPWRFGDENQLLESFFTALANKLEGRIETRGEKISDLVRKYSWVATPLEAFKLNYFGVEASINAKETLEKLAEAKPRADITELKERIEKVLEESDKKIVVIMDDIDRLDKEEIQAVFRLIKLTADFPNTIYLLSFDIERVSEALAEKYGSKEAGRSFLEKIIQVSLPLPFLNSNKLVKLTFDNINKLLEENNIILQQEEDSEWSYFFVSKFSTYLKSPRLVKKYINNLWFALPTNKDEINVYDLQTIEAIHTFLPELYEVIKSNGNMFLLEPESIWFREEEEKKHIENLKKFTENFPQERRKNIEEIIQKLFPRTSGAFRNHHYGRDSYGRWEKEKRICSPIYFPRYFGFGVSNDDISDSELKNFVENLESKTEDENSTVIRSFITNNRQELFLQKVSAIADNLNENQSIKLAKALSLLGEYFPKGSQDNILLALTNFNYAARLLRHLLENVVEEERISIGVEIASMIKPLDFASEFFRFAKYIGREKDEDNEELTELGKAIIRKIVERTKSEAEEENLEIRYPQYSADLYRQWFFEDKESLIQHLKTKTEANPEYAEAFILSFRKQSWAVNGTANAWGFDFITSAISSLHPEIEVTEIENYSREGGYISGDEKQYLTMFLRIAKTAKEIKTESVN